MLGLNIGKKVGAGVVQDQYNDFLKNKSKKNAKVKPMTAEEKKQAKRNEMRKKGIMVKADDKDEVPTFIEKGDGPFSPWVIKLPEKPVRWTADVKKSAKAKKKRLLEEGSEKSIKTTRSSKSMSRTKKKLQRRERMMKYYMSKSKTDPSDKSATENKLRKSKTDRGIKERKKDKKKKSKASKETITKPTSERHIKESKPEIEPIRKEIPEMKSAESVKHDVIESDLKKELVKNISPPGDKSREKVEPVDVKEEIVGITQSDSARELSNKKRSLASEISSTRTEKMVPVAERQTGAFEILDDEEFEKVASVNVLPDADEQEILKLAPKLLKVAKKHNAMEKCLTKEQNEILAKFFSGKMPLDATVLKVLDDALNRIIDHLQKNNCEVDEETKKLMKKRDKLKAAMMKEFLVSPQYLPKTWTTQFNKWKSEADKNRNGINWFRILFEYPKHKSFNDGPEDNFGNFNRTHRGLVLGIILGPNDAKSFTETKREEMCSGMFLDTHLIENAGKDGVTSKSSNTSITVKSDPKLK